ncbi:aldehyde dehydrogenase (NADP(+)) [Paraburkholderia tropica]|uniref:NADP-dependent aldehyde dehydrogenase n=1 Tax=Paraburkholderia tropica TaxID=92647 RepID=A0ABX5MQ93_9BURK|nr:aldehyde dehydrogenase (NADP(+)) [Paraburkholderia tropica]MDE1143686.1 aldehyde dehydrogenase (NADP(+)) [Paraburkholderia tropica]PXX16902.1 NADP-dependent aldehyde dehydrogenase [Paraburkholderia tropica]PZW83955.1 NADP-dependent aldehyde dehydrogenase [Paraburkholderia tropica]
MTTDIQGMMTIGGTPVKGADGVTYAHAALTGEALAPAFGCASADDVERACTLAADAFDAYRALSDERRAAFLEAIAQALIDLGPALTERAHLETALPMARLEGERMRTVNQLKLFAAVVRDGRWHGAIIDPALPQRAPLPRPDLRLRRIGLGPVAVFGASNFPLAFSVAGGDTASALAAGCPVIVKAHPAHLGTSELVGHAIARAARETGMPDGVFSLLIGEGTAVGEALVRHPEIQAVGFTGSRQGGLALQRIAQARPEPIPVYAEMSSINPVVLLPAALETRGEQIASEYADSIVLGTGQFCTNPGIVLALEGAALDAFCAKASQAISAKAATTMLTPNIHAAYCRGVDRLSALADVTTLANGREAAGAFDAVPALLRTDARAFLAEAEMQEEIFGPSSLIVACRDLDELRTVLRRMSGQLTATVHLDEADHEHARALLPTLERKAGRVLFNAFPTGVEVSHAMVHGGPFPATSDTRTTSVGATAIDRFLRPVCYQSVPDTLLPDALKQANPLDIWRLYDGDLKRD